jgi:hypothetical protein
MYTEHVSASGNDTADLEGKGTGEGILASDRIPDVIRGV